MRKSDLTLILVATLLVLSLGISVLAFPQKRYSEVENRALTPLALPSATDFFDGSALTRLSAAYADQFPFRSTLTSLKAQMERLLGKQENNGVFFGKEGYLIARCEYEDLTVLQENLCAISALFRATDLPVSLLIAPRAMDVMSHCLPNSYEADPAPFELLSQSGIPYTLPIDLLRTEAREGLSVWYKTDHHWTTLGAYLAYTAIAESLGISPYPLSYFSQETVSEEFLGTTYSGIGAVKTEPDSVILFRYEGDEEYLVTRSDTGETLRGFYRFDALEKKDQYEIFLGGNFSRLSISLPHEQNRPRLLLIKDSFANSLVPFLALHFDLELVDPRYEKTGLLDLLRSRDLDRILVLQGLDTLATDRSLARRVQS